MIADKWKICVQCDAFRRRARHGNTRHDARMRIQERNSIDYVKKIKFQRV